MGAGLLWALRRPVRNSLVFLLFLKGKSTILDQVAPGGPREAIPDYSGLAWAGLHCLPSMLDFDAIYLVPFALGPLGEHFCTLFTWYRLLWDPWGSIFARYLQWYFFVAAGHQIASLHVIYNGIL